jgi:uncharacterized protein YndB with AHSA1/START domain
MEKQAVERTIWIAAPRQRIWEAITDPEKIPLWLLPALPGAVVKRDESDRLSVRIGEMEAGFAVFESLDPPRQVTSRSLPDALLATTYTLEDEKGGTRVTVTMTGFESLPEDARDDRVTLSGASWDQALANLKAHVGGADLPFPQAAVAPLFGYWRESTKKLAVERSIWIAAPRQRVWEAITDPEQVGQWFSPGTHWRGTGPKVGGTLSVYNPETNTDMYVQIIDVVDPPNRLVTHSAPPDIPHVTTWTLVEENGGTRLTLTYTGFELEPDESRWINMEQNAFGFGMMLGNLKAHIDGVSLPYPQGF